MKGAPKIAVAPSDQEPGRIEDFCFGPKEQLVL